MRIRLPRPLLNAAAFSVLCLFGVTVVALPVAGQQQPRPTPEQAQELLRTRPDLTTQLEQRLRTSGLTPDQVRARLRAEGYPEALLDSYLPGSRSGRARGEPLPASRLLDVMQTLGLADTSEVARLRADARDDAGSDADTLPRRRTVPTGARDFVVDTVTRDSLTRLDPARLPDTSRVVSPRDSIRLLLEALRDSASRRERTATRDSGFAVFGLDLFRSPTSLFEANAAGPVDRSYRLGPGDRLVLLLTGDVEQAYDLQVTREGFIVIPQVGQLYVANLTLGGLESLLYARLGRTYSGIRRGAGATTRFSVSVSQLRSNQVFVVGDVERPGSYRISSAGTALTALYAAGGPTEAGSLRRVEVRRGGRTIEVLDVYDYLLRGDASRDARLETGDVVFVPPRLARVRAVGEVLRPATYELRPSETAADLLRAAGGLTALAAPQRVQIERVVPAAQRTAGGGRERVVLDVPASDGALAATPLAAGDVVRVFRIADRVRNRVVVRGNVWRPGPVGLAPGMRVSDAIRAAGGLKPDTYLGEVLVARLQPDSTRRQLRALLRDSTGAVIDDFELREDDELQLFSTTEFRPERFVAIGGAVRNGGRFRYREGMTMRDLVLLAGGLEEGALLTQAEVARLPVDRSGPVTAQTIRVALDSTFLTERTDRGSAVAPAVALQPYDFVLILRTPGFQQVRTVFVGGEVRFPGRYALRTRDERLSEVIARAGGPTSEADPEGVVFQRTRGRIGRVGVDLAGVLRSARHRENLLLQDGDSILVAPRAQLVYVEGEVNAPVAVPYVPGADLDHYVRAAGGPGARADLARAYVVQPNGKIASARRRRLLPDDVPEPRPGARVFVPLRLEPTAPEGIAQTIGVIVQVIGALSAILLTVSAVRRN